MPTEILSSDLILGYQGNRHTLAVVKMLPEPGDCFGGLDQPHRYEIHDDEGTSIFSSEHPFSLEVASDIIKALGYHFEDGRQFGRAEKLAEIRKSLEIFS